MRGIGFSGISLVGKAILLDYMHAKLTHYCYLRSIISVAEKEVAFTVGEPLTVALTFRSARADGLIMVLTTNNSSKAILAIGLRNGRVHKMTISYTGSNA